jgi:polyphosphate kinase
MTKHGYDEDEKARRLRADRIDSLDEELELELEDGAEPDQVARRRYFTELFRLQGELVKLQDWVMHTKYKLVVLFEGRDAAGKGGVIKRITQRLNPRVCRVAARAHAVVLPALRFPPAGGRRDRAVRPELVQPRRR